MFISPKNTNRKLGDDIAELLHGLVNEKDENLINLIVKVKKIILKKKKVFTKILDN